MLSGKYRGLTLHNPNGGEFDKIMITGDLIHSGGKMYIHPVANKVHTEGHLGKIIIMHEIYPDSLGLCTNVADKEGKEIYVGDYVLFEWDNNMKLIMKVVYDEGCFLFRPFATPAGNTIYDYWDLNLTERNKAKVVGSYDSSFKELYDILVNAS